jgi:hypothetical protein
MGNEEERILLFLKRIPYTPIDETRSKIPNNVVKDWQRDSSWTS